MNKNLKLTLGSIFLFMIILGGTIHLVNQNKKSTHQMEATVLKVTNNQLTVQDKNHIIYTLNSPKNIKIKSGEKLLIQYTGLLDKNKDLQTIEVLDYTKTISKDDEIPNDWIDNGIFSDYYQLAYQKLKTLSLDEKITQILLVRYPGDNALEILKEKQFGGYIFFEKDFKNKTKTDVQKMMKNLQNVAKIPILTAVDEEGGKVVRVSSNPNLANEKFLSSKDLYALGGFPAIRQDTIQKSELLKSLGLNLNLAPVVDVTTNSSAYMYERTLGENTELTSTYAKTVIEASKNYDVSYTLKHFPGYGNNDDTHITNATDGRSYDEIINQDLPPFQEGIKAGAEAVLVSHNTVTSIDASNPSSLSSSVHNLLRNQLGFTGIVITDDLNMGATSSISNATLKAILAGNDLIITTDYQKSIDEIKTGLESGSINENLIDKLAFRVIAWKYYKGLIIDNQK